MKAEINSKIEESHIIRPLPERPLLERPNFERLVDVPTSFSFLFLYYMNVCE